MATVLPGSIRATRAARFFASPANYLDGNYRIAARIETVRELLGDIRGREIVDLGCGNGAIAAALGDRLTLVDTSPAMLEQSRRHAPAATRIAAAIETFDDGGRFDVALCLGVLSHVDSTEDVIRAVSRALRPGGLAVIQLSDSGAACTRVFHALHRIWRKVRPGALRYRPTNLRTVEDALSAHGLRVVEVRRHMLLLPGLARLLGPRLVAWDRFVRRRPWLARHAMDVVLVARKH